MFDSEYVPQSLYLPIAIKSWQAGLAGEELLHGSLFDCVLFVDQAIYSVQQCIHVTEGVSDGALFGERGDDKGHPQ